jgi:hypothetical protein
MPSTLGSNAIRRSGSTRNRKIETEWLGRAEASQDDGRPWSGTWLKAFESNTASRSAPRSPSTASEETLEAAPGFAARTRRPPNPTAAADTQADRSWPTPPTQCSANSRPPRAISEIETPSDFRSRRISAQSSTISTCFLPGSTPARVAGKLVKIQLRHRGQYSVAPTILSKIGISHLEVFRWTNPMVVKMVVRPIAKLSEEAAA